MILGSTSAYFKHTSCFREFGSIECMKKVYFFESGDQPKVWEKMTESVNGKILVETTWNQSKKLNGESQKVLSQDLSSRIPQIV